MALPALFLVAIAAYLCSVLFPGALLDWLVSSVSLIIVAAVFRMVKPFIRMLGMIMLGIGLCLLLADHAGWQQYVLSFGRMLNVLSLFALIPLIAIPIELGQYALRVQVIIQRKVKSSGLLYSITSGLAYISSSFMNLASLPMMYQTMRPSIDLYPIGQKERFMSRSITHGFAMPTVWTPVTPIVGIVVEMTGVRWLHILPILIPFSIAGLAADCLIAHWIASRRRKRLGASAVEEASAARESGDYAEALSAKAAQASHPLQIVIAILAFNGLISVLEATSHAGFLLLVTLTVIPYAFVWAALIGKGRAFLKKSREKLPVHLLKMKDQFFIFLSAGFMISAIQTTGASGQINAALGTVMDLVGPQLFLLLIPLMPLGLAFLGLQPAVALALTAESMNPQALGVPPELTAVAMLTGAAAAFMMGPYNATASMMAGLIDKSSHKVSHWNAPFTAAYLGMALLLLLVLKFTG